MQHGELERSRTLWVRDVAPAAVVLVIFCLLVGLELNGSSIGVMSRGASPWLAGSDAAAERFGPDPALVAGTPRPIRSDEWVQATPIAVAQARSGFRTHAWIGLTYADVDGTPYGSPSLSPTQLFRPQGWGYLLLGASRGLSWQWWFPYALCWIGLYFLLLRLSLSRVVAIGLATAGTLTPYAAWWSNGPAMTLGFIAAATAALLAALESKRFRSVMAFGSAAGFFGASAVIAVYPPWTVSVGLVSAAVVVGWLIDRRPRTAVVLASLGAALVVLIIGVTPWAIASRDAIAAIAGTVYPGQRVSMSGEAHLSYLMDAAINPLVAFGASLGTENPSETSSTWLPLPMTIILAAVLSLALWREFVRPRSRMQAKPNAVNVRWTTLLVLVVMALLLVWALLPGVPPLIGRLTLLSHVQGSRLPLALGFALVILVALAFRWDPLVRGSRLRWGLIVACSLTSAAASTWAASQLLPLAGRRSLALAFIFGGLLGLLLALIALSRWIGAASIILTAYVFASWALVNPLYHGLGPLVDDPVVLSMESYAAQHPNARVAVFGDLTLNALVRSSGVQVLSGTTPYPDRSVWNRIDPGDEALWNSYRNYVWYPDATADPISADVTFVDAANLKVNPCSPKLAFLQLDLIVSTTPLRMSCLEPLDTIDEWGRVVYRYSAR